MADKFENWSVEQVRMTAFRAESPDPDIKGWDAIFGEPPEAKTEQAKLGVREERGAFGDGQLVFRIDPVRCEWRWSGGVFPNSEGIVVPLLGPLEETLAKFSEIVTKWLDSAPPLNRLAFGAVLLSPIKDHVEGYRRLQNFLPDVRLDPDHSSDFFYQINRQRAVEVNGHSFNVNRLSKWTAVNLQVVSFQLTSQIMTGGTSTHYARLELDINSAPDAKFPDTAEFRLAVWRVLVELGEEISTKGDVK